MLRAAPLSFFLFLGTLLSAQSDRWSYHLELPLYKAVGTGSGQLVGTKRQSLTIYGPDRIAPTSASVGVEGFVAYRLLTRWWIGGGAGLRLDPTRANTLTTPATRYVHYNIPFFAFSEYRVRLGKVVGMGLRVRGGHQFHRHSMEANNMDFFAARGGLLAGADLRISWENRKFLPYLTLGYSHMRYRQAYNLTAFPGGRASGFTASLHAFQEDIRLAIGLSL